MSKLIWKPCNFEYPLPVVMVTCGSMENSNIITVAWTGIINSHPPMCYISIRPERFSYNLIKKNMEFAINLVTSDLAYATDWCGVKSGLNEDKFKKMNLTKEKANLIKCPIIKESPVSIECKVKEIKHLGSHDMFLAEVLSVDVDKKYFNKDGAFDIQKCNLITYANGKYFQLGKQIGKFGYSVKKKRIKNNKKCNK